MKARNLALGLAAVVGLGLVTATPNTAEAGDPWGVNIRLGSAAVRFGHGGGYYPGDYRSTYRHRGRPAGTYRGARGHYDWHDTSHYDWHDTSHYDYIPGGYRPHGNHFDYVPGSWRLHREGHWDLHRDGHHDYHRGGHYGH